MDIIDKIDQSMYNYDELRDMEIVLEMALLIDEDTIINEEFSLSGFKSGMSSLMKKTGFGAHKHSEGLIGIALKSGKIMAEFIWHALKAVGGNEKSKERVKEIANTEITKDDFMNFLLKLDLATLHLITGPLHFIDAVTGWDITYKMKSKSGDVLKKAKEAIENLMTASKSVDVTVRKKLKSLMHGVARLFGFDDVQEIISQV